MIGGLGCEAAANGFVLVYATGHMHDRFDVSAAVSLPKRSLNRSWYCSWLMILPVTREPHPPFVQVGIIRRPDDGNKLTPFVATSASGQPVASYDDDAMPKIADDAQGHRVQVRVGFSSVVLKLDGRTLTEFSRFPYFPAGRYRTFYAQLGGEVSEHGDSVSGTVSSIEIHDENNPSSKTYQPRCGFQDDGLQLRNIESGYAAFGVFGGVPSRSFVQLPDMHRVSKC